VTYTSLGIFTLSKIYVFEGAYGDNWQWLRQPVSDKLRQDFEQQIQDKIVKRKLNLNE
jgi:hypothetical protein